MNTFETWKSAPLADQLPDNDDPYTDVKLAGADDPTYETVLSKVTGAEVRAVYEGKVNQYGGLDSRYGLEGGTADGQMYANDTAKRGIEYANNLVKTMSSGEFQLLILDVLRLSKRQIAGFKKAMIDMMKSDGMTNPEPADYLRYGAEATKFFGRVRPIKDDQYEKLFIQLKKDAVLMGSIASWVEVPSEDDKYPAALDSALADYITTAANMGIGEAGAANLDLTATHIVHGGGATFDFLIADRHGDPVSIVPYDYINMTLTAYRFTENDENYNVLIKAINSDPILADHFNRLGYKNASEFTRVEWNYFKEANRVQVKLIMAMNGTTYQYERWHFEFGENVTDFKGRPLNSELLSPKNSGGTGYTAIRHGAEGTAIWHTRASENYLRRKGLLAE